MSLKETAPQFFVSGVSGVALEGPNVMVSFSTFAPSEDHKSRTYLTNVRIIMSVDALRQSLQFIDESLNQPAPQAAPAMPMPGLPQ